MPSPRHWLIPSFLTAQSRHLHLDQAIVQPLSVAWAACHVHDDEACREHACSTRTAIGTTLPPLASPIPAPQKTSHDGHGNRDQRSIGWYPHQEPRIRHPPDARWYLWLPLRHRHAREHSRMACCAGATTDIPRWRRGASCWNTYAQGAT